MALKVDKEICPIEQIGDKAFFSFVSDGSSYQPVGATTVSENTIQTCDGIQGGNDKKLFPACVACSIRTARLE